MLGNAQFQIVIPEPDLNYEAGSKAIQSLKTFWFGPVGKGQMLLE